MPRLVIAYSAAKLFANPMLAIIFANCCALTLPNKENDCCTSFLADIEPPTTPIAYGNVKQPINLFSSICHLLKLV